MIQNKLRSLIYAGLGLVLCVLLCGGIGMTAQAAESKAYGDFTYEEGENGITITKYTGESKKVVIPDKINGIEITAGIGLGIATSKAVEAVARQPEADSKITKLLIIGGALAEATAVYGLVIGLLIILLLK